MVPLDCPLARGCVGIASRVPAANPRQFVTRTASERARAGRTPSYWPYDQVVTECRRLRPRAMQVINCAAWHGQQCRKDVARRDSMAASTPIPMKQVKNMKKKCKKNRRLRRAGGPHLPPAWVPPRALAPPPPRGCRWTSWFVLLFFGEATGISREMRKSSIHSISHSWRGDWRLPSTFRSMFPDVGNRRLDRCCDLAAAARRVRQGGGVGDRDVPQIALDVDDCLWPRRKG